MTEPWAVGFPEPSMEKNFLYTSRTVSFLLAGTVAILVVSFVFLVDGTPFSAIFVAGIISFAATFMLSLVLLDFLIFKEVDKIYANLDKMTRGELPMFMAQSAVVDGAGQSKNPLKRINQDLQNYVTRKEEEIDKLKRLEAYRKEFIADVSHELKTPIFAAQGYILTLLDGAIDDDRVKYKFLKKAAKSLNGLDTVVQDLLTLSQIESGVIVMQFVVFDIQSLTQDVFEQLESKAAKKDITLRFLKVEKQGVYVNADINRINQVMTNLISNAIKYGNEGGFVEVALKDSGTHIEVSVKDNGQGIPPEHLERVFERFYRVDKSRSKKQGGTGLGLAIVKHILEGHHTKITASSHPSTGTIFQFKLQKAQE
jgi:two-component system phosphate regulon sensor histidine kinase PhoR